MRVRFAVLRLQLPLCSAVEVRRNARYEFRSPFEDWSMTSGTSSARRRRSRCRRGRKRRSPADRLGAELYADDQTRVMLESDVTFSSRAGSRPLMGGSGQVTDPAQFASANARRAASVGVEIYLDASFPCVAPESPLHGDQSVSPRPNREYAKRLVRHPRRHPDRPQGRDVPG